MFAILRKQAHLRAGGTGLGRVFYADDRVVRRVGGFFLLELGVSERAQQSAQLRRIGGIIRTLRNRPMPAALVQRDGRRRAPLEDAHLGDRVELRGERREERGAAGVAAQIALRAQKKRTANGCERGRARAA